MAKYKRGDFVKVPETYKDKSLAGLTGKVSSVSEQDGVIVYRVVVMEKDGLVGIRVYEKDIEE